MSAPIGARHDPEPLGDLGDAYTEVARRLGVMPKTNGRAHAGPKLVN